MEVLKKLRKEHGYNQSVLANLLNISVSAYGNYELDQREPNIESLKKIADFYGVTIDYLLGRDPITPAERAAGWIDTKKANLTPQEDDWLAKRDEILRLYGDEGLKAVTAMIDTYINAKTANFQQKTDKNGTKY